MITLSSDFVSPYPAAMRGVLHAECEATIVDVTHDFPRQDVRTAAFWLREVLPTFPPAVHLAVIDPGVGTDRAALVIRAGDHALVGPDNGVLIPAGRTLAATEPNETDGEETSSLEVYEIDMDDPASATFHGRDVFAPMAASVHRSGIDAFESVSELSSAESYTELSFPAPTQQSSGVEGEILVVDGFGTAITNIPGEMIETPMGETIEVDGEAVPVERSYAYVDPGERLLTIGSHGNVELAVNQGRGEEAFAKTRGDSVHLTW